MALCVFLTEEDLRSMPPELRERLLKWYFDNRPPKTPPQSAPTVEIHPEPVPQRGADDLSPDTKRITFPELVKAGLLRPGEEIYCRTLKRQQRKGLEAFIRGAKVVTDGRIEFQGQKFSGPSKLARAMVNANGGKAEALNGYDYLFVQTAKGLVRLDELRERVSVASLAEEAEVDTLMEETGAFADREEALKYVRNEKSRK